MKNTETFENFIGRQAVKFVKGSTDRNSKHYRAAVDHVRYAIEDGEIEGTEEEVITILKELGGFRIPGTDKKMDNKLGNKAFDLAIKDFARSILKDATSENESYPDLSAVEYDRLKKEETQRNKKIEIFSEDDGKTIMVEKSDVTNLLSNGYIYKDEEGYQFPSKFYWTIQQMVGNTNEKNEIKKIKKLNETGEWSSDIDLDYVLANPDDDDEEVVWIKYLYDNLKTIQSKVKPIKLEINNIKGFDKYQGPYASIEINGQYFTVWTTENSLWIEDFPVDNTSDDGKNPGFEGNVDDISNVITKHYTGIGNQVKKFNETIENNQKGTKTILLSVEVKTDKDNAKIKSAIKKGIYKGLDTEGNYIARPKDVKIKFN